MTSVFRATSYSWDDVRVMLALGCEHGALAAASQVSKRGQFDMSGACVRLLAELHPIIERRLLPRGAKPQRHERWSRR